MNHYSKHSRQSKQLVSYVPHNNEPEKILPDKPAKNLKQKIIRKIIVFLLKIYE